MSWFWDTQPSDGAGKGVREKRQEGTERSKQTVSSGRIQDGTKSSRGDEV
jgi:hypothetical protein